MIVNRLLAGVAVAAASTLALAAPAAAKTLEAVASFTVLADMVRQVGGDHVHVISLVPPNGDPHEYEPTPDDARSLKQADVVITSGLGLEGWFARLAKASGYAGRPVVASDGIKTRKMEEDGKTVTDPHAWNSIPNAETYVRNIEAALAKADPEDAATFKTNADGYEAKLRDLDAYAHAQVDSVPKSERKVLTTHDALSYFGAAYGVTFLSPLGFSTENEPSARRGRQGDQPDQGGTRARLFLRELQRPAPRQADRRGDGGRSPGANSTSRRSRRRTARPRPMRTCSSTM